MISICPNGGSYTKWTHETGLAAFECSDRVNLTPSGSLLHPHTSSSRRHDYICLNCSVPICIDRLQRTSESNRLALKVTQICLLTACTESPAGMNHLLSHASPTTSLTQAHGSICLCSRACLSTEYTFVCQSLQAQGPATCREPLHAAFLPAFHGKALSATRQKSTLKQRGSTCRLCPRASEEAA